MPVGLRPLWWAAFLGVVCCCVAASQTRPGTQFEVASVRPASTGASPDIVRKQGGPGSSDPGRVVYHNYPIRDLIKEAYQVLPTQLVAPAWLTSVDILRAADTFEIEAKFPVGTTKEQYRLMLQGLLTERFGLKVHRETREGPVYQLVVDKGGLKISPLPEGSAGTEDDSTIPAMLLEPLSIPLGSKGEDGFPKVPVGYSGFLVGAGQANHVRYKFMRMTMAEFAGWLWWKIRSKPVLDQTQMKGKYDFYLEHVNGMPSEDDVAPGGDTLFAALQKQLGLKLVSGKGEFEMLVIDHVERLPGSN